MQHIQDRALLGFSLEIDQELRQAAKVTEMVFSVEQLISFMSYRFTLSPGDIILTGTPKGVGALQDQANILLSLFEGERTLFTIETVSLGVLNA